MEGRFRSESALACAVAETVSSAVIDLPFGDSLEVDFESERRWLDADHAISLMARARHELQVAEAARVGMLLDAYEAVTREAADTYGPAKAGRGGTIVKSFLLEAALVLNVSEKQAAHLLDTATEAREHLPVSWKLFRSGECSWRGLDLIVQQAFGLDDDRLPEYDRQAAAAVAVTAGPKLKHTLHVTRERLQSDTAVVRTRAAVATRHTEVAPLPDGLASFTLVGPAAEIAALDDGLTKAAVAAHGADDEERCISALKFDIAADLLIEGLKDAAAPDRDDLRVPQRKGVVPQVYVTVPVLTALGHTTEPATLAGYGPIDIETAKELTAQAPSITRILTDPVTGVRVAMDRTTYTVPADMRRWLRVRDETCRAPGCRRLAHQCDIDHVIPWVTLPWIEGGKTNLDNLAHLCRRHHEMKGDGWWHIDHEPDGRQVWVSQFGGRRYVTEPADAAEPIHWATPPSIPDLDESAG